MDKITPVMQSVNPALGRMVRKHYNELRLENMGDTSVLPVLQIRVACEDFVGVVTWIDPFADRFDLFNPETLTCVPGIPLDQEYASAIWLQLQATWNRILEVSHTLITK